MTAADFSIQIRSGAKAGLSASQIARGLIGSGLTKNAVIGWCHRNGVTLQQHNRARRILTDEQAQEIYSSTETHKTLAARFNINRGTVSQIKRGICYRSVTGHGKSA